MQSKSVTFFARGKAVRENAREIFCRNPNAIISNNDVNGALVDGEDGERDRLIRAFDLIECILRVANEIDEYLQHLVAIDSH